MREIKFRAWVFWNEHYQWADSIEIFHDGSWGFYIGEEGNQYGASGEESDFLEQFTGLKDKNGREIYEGDIVQDIDDDIEYGEDDSEIIIHKKYLVGEMDGRGCDPFGCPAFGGYEWENLPLYRTIVIGNIHENPELLK